MVYSGTLTFTHSICNCCLCLWVCFCPVSSLVSYFISRLQVTSYDIRLVWLISLSVIIFRPIHVVTIALFHSLLWLRSIPLYICAHLLYPSASGYTGFFHVLVLWIVLLWTQGCIYLYELEFCSDICLAMGLLDQLYSFLAPGYSPFSTLVVLTASFHIE